jgi:2-methylcitrate dehydratase
MVQDHLKDKIILINFLTLTDGILDKKESDRFIKTVQKLKTLKPGQLDQLNIEVKKSKIKRNLKKGIF